MRAHLINVSRFNPEKDRYEHFFRVEVNGTTEEAREVAQELADKFEDSMIYSGALVPVWKVEFYIGSVQYFTRTSIFEES